MSGSPDRPRISTLTQEELSLPAAELAGLMADVLARGAVFRFKAPGVSMYPFIRDGDVLTVRACNPRHICCGDVLVCRVKEQLAVHRVVKLKDASFLTKGDNLSQDDGWTGAGDVIGITVKVERNERSVGFGQHSCLIAWLSRHRLLWPAKYLASAMDKIKISYY